MQYVLLKLPSSVLCVIIIGALSAFSAASLLVVRRLVPHHRLKQHNDMTGSVFATVGVLYAVLLAFVVVAVWQDFDRAGVNMQKEANYLMDIYRDEEAFSPEFKQKVRSIVKDYTYNLVNDEWDRMSCGGMSDKVTNVLNNMWASFSAYQARTPTEQAFFEESIRKLNDLGEARRTRLMDARLGVHPLIWIVLMAGGVVTMVFISFFGAENLKAQMTMALMLAALVGLILFTIAAMDYPYTGEISVSPEIFRYMLTWLK
jgi:ABC-type multidrug transport system fused ATPase/permease subunit